MEKICELDDDLTMMYLEGEEPSVDQLKAALRRGTCECTAVPVCCGSACGNLKPYCRSNITGIYFVKLCSLVGMHLQDTSHTLFFVLRRIQHIGTGVDRAGIYTEERQLADKLADDAALYHDELVEKICELDDDLTMMYT